jgi:hypothetical protein
VDECTDVLNVWQTFLLLGLAANVGSAPFPIPKVEWERTLNGSSFAIASLPDGGVVGAGYSGGGTWTNVNFFLSKIRADGTVSWERSFGGTGYDDAYAVRPVQDGGFVVAGRSQSQISAGKATPNYGGSDYWMVCVDEEGNQLWDATFGGSRNDSARAVIEMSKGGYLVGGEAFSPADGNKTEPSYGTWDVWLVCVSTNGTKVWERSFGGTDSDGVWAVAGAHSGDYVVAGYSASPISGNKTAPAFGSWDMWIICVDADGGQKWDHSFGGSGFDYAQDIQRTRDGGFIVAGYSHSPISGNKTAQMLGFGDAWAVRLDAAGNKLWDLSFGTATGYEEFYAVAVAEDGGFIFSGVKNADMWLVRTDSSGNQLWERTFPSPELDRAHGVAALAGNRCVVGGILNIDGNEVTHLLKLGSDSPILGAPRVSGFSVSFSLNGTSNDYAIEFSTNLSTWSPLAANRITTTAQEVNVIDQAVSGERRFYRARLIP